MDKNKLKKEIIGYIIKNKSHYEISKFDGDIFWYNHIAFSEVGTLHKLVFFFIYFKNQPMHFWLVLPIHSPDIHRLGEKLYKKYLNRPQQLRDKFYLSQKGVRQTAERLSDQSLNKLKTVKKLHLNFVRSALRFAHLTILSFESLEVFLGKKINQVISNKKERKILTFSLYTSYVQRQQEELLKIIESLPKQEFLLLQKGVAKINQYSRLNRLLIKFQKEWGWTFLNYASHELPSINKILQTAIALVKNFKKEQEHLETLKKKRGLKLNKLKNLPPRSKKMIDLFDLLLELRDQRKAVWIQITVLLKKWLVKFASVYGLFYNDARWLLHGEQHLLNKNNRKKFLEIINQRKNNCVVCYGYGGKKYTIFTGKDALKIIGAVFKKEKLAVLKGVPACSGKVTGKAKIILSKLDFRNFREGDILVASHTTPDYVPIMKKATAILTERGGITSHAAIISRELEIPCIVGIRGLIGNFRDGDLVEVDANKGIVKIIKKAK